MRYLYNAGLSDGVKHLSSPAFLLLAGCSFLTGAGSNGGLAGSVNSTAKTFPDKAVNLGSTIGYFQSLMTMQRASTTGLVISGFGLSAFFFSTIAHLLSPGDTSSLLLILALGTSIPMTFGFFLVRPIPLPSRGGYEIIENDMPDEEAITTVLLPRGSNESHQNSIQGLEGPSEGRRLNSLSHDTSSHLEPLPNLHGKQLFQSADFWLLCIILSTRELHQIDRLVAF